MNNGHKWLVITHQLLPIDFKKIPKKRPTVQMFLASVFMYKYRLTEYNTPRCYLPVCFSVYLSRSEVGYLKKKITFA